MSVRNSDLDARVIALVTAGDAARAATEALQSLGPEVYGFLVGVVGAVDAEDVFADFSESFWRSLSTFKGRCSTRTWMYVIARHEIGRYRRGARRHEKGRVPISELSEMLEAVRTVTRSALGTEHRNALAHLRDELAYEDRALLVLRVDRKLGWDEIALAFADAPETITKEDQRRESARLRKRFQLVKARLMNRARDLDLRPR